MTYFPKLYCSEKRSNLFAKMISNINDIINNMCAINIIISNVSPVDMNAGEISKYASVLPTPSSRVNKKNMMNPDLRLLKRMPVSPDLNLDADLTTLIKMNNAKMNITTSRKIFAVASDVAITMILEIAVFKTFYKQNLYIPFPIIPLFGANMPAKKVKIYSTPTCPYCKQAKDFLKQNKIEFTDVDVSTNQKAANEMIEKSGQMGVPVIEINGDIIVGFDRPRIKKALGIA